MRSDVELSSHAKSLLRAAKGDAPGAVARAKIWGGVSSSVAGGATAAAAGGALLSSKFVFAGALFGGAVTVGLAATMLLVHSSSPQDAVEPRAAIAALETRAVVVPTETAARVAIAATAPDPVTARPLPAGERRSIVSPGLPSATSTTNGQSAPIAAPKDAPATPTVNEGGRVGQRGVGPARAQFASGLGADSVGTSETEDALMREASLLAEARGALGRGDAAGALAKVRLARSLPSKQLSPEELALEAQALRALGKGTEASGAEEKLKAQYPDHALAR